MKGPLINPEFEKTKILQDIKTRDAYMYSRQRSAAAVLSCIGQLGEILINSKDVNEKRKEMFKIILDAGSLAADLMRSQNKSRSNFYCSNLENREIKDVLRRCEPGNYLFGDNLSAKYKDCKDWEKILIF